MNSDFVIDGTRTFWWGMRFRGFPGGTCFNGPLISVSTYVPRCRASQVIIVAGPGDRCLLISEVYKRKLEKRFITCKCCVIFFSDEKKKSSFKAESDEWGADYSSEIHLAGRVILNLWRILKHEVCFTCTGTSHGH